MIFSPILTNFDTLKLFMSTLYCSKENIFSKQFMFTVIFSDFDHLAQNTRSAQTQNIEKCLK